MKKSQTHVGTRVDAGLKKKLDAFRYEHGIASESALIRSALTRMVTPDIEDTTLVFESLRQVHDAIHKLEHQQDIFFNFFCHFVQNFFAYNAEIPAALKEAAATSAMERYSRFFTTFKQNLQGNPSMFETMFADFVEEEQGVTIV